MFSFESLSRRKHAAQRRVRYQSISHSMWFVYTTVRGGGLGVMSAADMCHPTKAAAGRLCRQQNSKRNCFFFLFFFQGLRLEINNGIKWLVQVSEWSVHTVCPCRGRRSGGSSKTQRSRRCGLIFLLGFFSEARTAARIQRSRRLAGNPISSLPLQLKLLLFLSPRLLLIILLLLLKHFVTLLFWTSCANAFPIDDFGGTQEA